MFKKYLPEKRRLELEDKVDLFLQKKGLPHPRIEPDIVNILNEREEYISSISKEFEEEPEKFNKFFKQREDAMWCENLIIGEKIGFLDAVFYNPNYLKEATKDYYEYAFKHELFHLKQFDSSEIMKLLYLAKFPINTKIKVSSLLEGFAEYGVFNTNRTWFKENRKEDLKRLRKSLWILDKNNSDYEYQVFENEKLFQNPYISTFLLYNMLDYMGEEKEIKKLIINPLNENLDIRSKEEVNKFIKNNNLFKIKKEEFYQPHKYIQRLRNNTKLATFFNEKYWKKQINK